MARQKASLADLLARQPTTATPHAKAEAVETPFFDQVLEHTDTTSSGSFEGVLTKLTGAVDPAHLPQFPTPECLSPEDVYNLAALGLQQQAHLSGCPWCRNMVAAAQPSEQDFEQLLARCRQAAARARQVYQRV
jgi:hypothetical protein